MENRLKYRKHVQDGSQVNIGLVYLKTKTCSLVEIQSIVKELHIAHYFYEKLNLAVVVELNEMFNNYFDPTRRSTFYPLNHLDYNPNPNPNILFVAVFNTSFHPIKNIFSLSSHLENKVPINCNSLAYTLKDTQKEKNDLL